MTSLPLEVPSSSMTAHGSLGATPTGLISLDGTGSATLGMVPLAVPIGADEKERPRPFCGMAMVPDGAAAE